MRILIATPTSDSSCQANYVASLLSLQKVLLTQRPDIEMVGPLFPISSQVSASRNAAAGRVLDDPSITHLLFIDSDIGFRPSAVLKLCDYGADFSGCLCPARQLNKDLYFTRAAKAVDAQAAWRTALDFVSHGSIMEDNKAIKIVRGFTEMSALGAGLTLVSRTVLERMRDAYPHLVIPTNQRHRDLGATTHYAQFFESTPDAAGLYLSEDLAFSKRWTDLGGKIFACVDEEISHRGAMTFSGTAMERLRADATGARTY